MPLAHLSIVSKKPREPYQSWAPTEKEIAALEDSSPMPCQGQTLPTSFLTAQFHSFFRPTRSSKSWADVLLKRRPSMLCSQSPPPQFLLGR
jgi:hypothetical protein